MTKCQNINLYGYLNVSLYEGVKEKVSESTKNDPALLAYFFEISPEEIAYKAYWDAYLEAKG